MAERWTDEFLDAKRHCGDPPADAAIAAVAAAGELAAVNELLGRLMRNEDLVPEGLPEPVRRYLAAERDLIVRDPDQVEAGERVFAEHGPEILCVLACYSLPVAYAAKKGVQVLYQTGYLARRPNRRLFETTQMVLDVMTPGGIDEPTGRGRVTAEKVRLMHAAIRHMILQESDWDVGELGVPINQEDLAGTLMTFSAVILDGLDKLDVTLSDADKQAYLDAWRCVGRLMGVDHDLIPATVAEAFELTRIIQRRQIDPSEAGRVMTRALLEMLEGNVPGTLFDGFAAALMRHFVPADVADGLAIPEHRIEEAAVDLTSKVLGLVDEVVDGGSLRRRLVRAFSIWLMQGIVGLRLREVGRPFRIPAHLHTAWELPAEKEPDDISSWVKMWLGGGGGEPSR